MARHRRERAARQADTGTLAHFYPGRGRNNNNNEDAAATIGWRTFIPAAGAFDNRRLHVLYVMLGHRVARDGGTAGIDRLGAAMLVALLAVTPLGIASAVPTFARPPLLLAGIGVGICSSVIPYVCDQLAMARLPRATFALLLSLLPASAALIGALVLRQIPQPAEIAGIALVVCGVAIHQEHGAQG